MSTRLPDHAPPPTPPADTPPDRAAVALPSLRRRLVRRLRAGVLCLIAVAIGAGASFALGGGRSMPEPAAPESHAHEGHDAGHDAGAGHDHEPVANPTAARIDLMIRAGRFDDAWALCKDAPRNAYGKDERPLAYREGVCLEGLEQWAAARAAYDRAAADPGDPAVWVPAALGQARCAAAAGDHRAARAIVNRVVLRSGHPACQDQQPLDEGIPVPARPLDECLHFQARLALADLGRRPAPDPLDDTALAWPAPDRALEHTAVALPPHEPRAEPSPEPAAAGVVRANWSRWAPGVYEVTIHSPAARAEAALAAVAAAAGLTLRTDPTAAARLAGGDRVAVDVDRAPLEAVLTALTEPAGVAWRIGQGAITIDLPDPHAHAPAADQAAGTALRRAVACAPDHPHARAARVALANLDHDAGRVRLAADAYRAILDTDPHAPTAVYAAYNLGLIDLRGGTFGAARGRFLEVIDRGPHARWGALGGWWVGRTHLDAGDTRAARAALEPVLAGRSAEVASAAALGVCACHLLDGDDAAVRAVLRRHRFGNRDRYVAVAEWAEALLRYRAAPSDDRAEEVRTTLHESGDGQPLGPAGVYLAGQAYAETGRPDRMVDLYEAATAAGRGPLAVRMTFDAAEHLYQLDRRAPARQRFLAVTVADPAGLGPRAQLRVAELAARDGRGAECVRRCRTVAGRPGVEPAELLPVMGRGFELEGRYRAAAECFAGRLPAE